MDLDVLLARAEITDQLHAYGRGCDLIDVELIASVFHADAVADYGPMFQGTGRGFAEFIGQVHPTMVATVHAFTNISIRVDGDRAGSETYTHHWSRTQDPDGTLHNLASFGRYVDEWERRDGVWRITRRRYLHSFDDISTSELHLFELSGSRDRNDPSHEVLA